MLGGGAGTTRDCLELIHQAEKYGARVALFGRKIYYSENSVLMLRAMRRVIEERISSEEGVKAYHADLKAAGIAAHRTLADDLVVIRGGAEAGHGLSGAARVSDGGVLVCGPQHHGAVLAG